MYMWRTVWNPLNVSNPFWGRLSAAPLESPCSCLPPPSLVMAYRCALSFIRFMQYACPSDSFLPLRLPLPVPCLVPLTRPMATDSPLLASAAGAVPSACAICNALAHAHISFLVCFPRFASETAIFRRLFVTSPNLSVRRSFLITKRLNRYNK